MKRRLKTNKLYNAELIGWRHSFPDDIWTMIVPALKPKKDSLVEPGVLLALMHTNKLLAKLACGLAIELLSDFIAFDSNHQHNLLRAPQSHAERFFASVSVIIRVSEDELRWIAREAITYIKQTLSLKKEDQTLERLSNCLAFLHLVHIESLHLYKDGVYQPLKITQPGVFTRLKDIRYYRADTRKVVCLSRMPEVVAWYNFPYAYLANNTTFPSTPYEEAKRILHERNDASLDNPIDKLSASTLVVDTLAEAGITIPASRSNGELFFRDVVVKLDARQHHIFSPAAEAFRQRCFVSHGVKVEDLVDHYLATRNHLDNWRRIQCYCTT